MKHQHILSALFLIAALTGGCASGPSDNPGRTESRQQMMQGPGDKAFFYRLQAAELSDMAKRLEFEAEWYAKQSGQDSEQAKRNREMAKELWSAAGEADQLSREYRNQLPHNQAY